MSILGLTGSSLKALGKVVLLSRLQGRVRKLSPRPEVPLFILGNGPSLRKALDEFTPELAASQTLAVNFAANSPEFRLLRPSFYVLADPHFFRHSQTDDNVRRLWQSLRDGAEWGMTLFVPATDLAAAKVLAHGVKVEAFNYLGVEGFRGLRHILYGTGLAMPRPRNVLIPSLMIGLALGFRDIVLLGADHSWMSTLSVTDSNEVVSVQPHFYKEDKKEETRVRHEYAGIRLHTIVESFAVAFRAYHEIAAWAGSLNARIINATPGSFIDAFPRASLESVLSRS